MPGQFGFGGGTDEDQVHRCADLRVGGDPQHHAVAGAGGVDPHERIGGFADRPDQSRPRQREAQRLRIAAQRLRQRLQRKPVGQPIGRRQVGAEHAVDEDQPRPVDAGQRKRRRIDHTRRGGGIATGEAALTEPAQRGVLPRLDPRIGQAAGGERRAVLAPRRVQPGDAAGRQRRVEQRRDQRQGCRLAHAKAPGRRASAGWLVPMPA